MEGVPSSPEVSDGTVYVLNNGSEGIGFYKLKSGFKANPGRAYLIYDSSAAREFFSFDETSGIEMPTVNVNDDIVFDLQGRRVAQPTKGLYIVNGKKVIIK